MGDALTQSLLDRELQELKELETGGRSTMKRDFDNHQELEDGSPGGTYKAKLKNKMLSRHYNEHES